MQADKPEELAKRRMVELLWGWTICPGCQGQASCPGGNCPAGRFVRLVTFWRCIQNAAEYLEIQYHQYGTDATYDEVFAILEKLRVYPDTTRGQLVQVLPSQPQGNAQLTQSRHARAISLAVWMLLMVDCYGSRQNPGQLESGQYQLMWRDNETFHHYALTQVVQGAHPIFADPGTAGFENAIEQLQAARLQKRARLKFKPTDCLSRHLLLDQKSHTVEVFHHTTFLKEHLLASKSAGTDPM